MAQSPAHWLSQPDLAPPWMRWSAPSVAIGGAGLDPCRVGGGDLGDCAPSGATAGGATGLERAGDIHHAQRCRAGTAETRWPRGAVLGAFRHPRGGQALSLTLAPYVGRTGRNRNLAESAHACCCQRRTPGPAQRAAVRDISSRPRPRRRVNPANAGPFCRGNRANEIGCESAKRAGCGRLSGHRDR